MTSASLPGRRPAVAGPRSPRGRRAYHPRRRLLVLLVVMILAFTGVIVRLADVQGFAADRYAELGESQRMRSVVLPAQRGSILDRNGAELAMSLRQRTVWADPRAVVDPGGAARRLAPVLGVDEGFLHDRLTADAAFVYLARKVDDAVAEQVEALGLRGIDFLDEPRRFAPAGALGAPFLGQVGVDDEGLSGLELQYEDELRGRPGTLVVERDPSGRDIASGVRQLRPPRRGHHLALTIDRAMQYETERVLAEQITASRARGGIAVVMEPRSGDILAMASLRVPKVGEAPVSTPENAAVTSVYEPGSVNKVVTIAAALEEEAIPATGTLVVPDTLTVADSEFHDAEPHPTQRWTVSDVVANSSNIGTILIAKRLGAARMHHYLEEFGLAERTALAFPGEAAGILPDVDEWSGTSMGTVPIGQGVAVTALQMLGAFNTIANDGAYVAPRLVSSVVDARGRSEPVARPEARQVISATTADHVTGMLEQVVEEGTGTAAAVDGYRVAGKTGTARKPIPGGVGYKEGAYLASFAGFLPAEAPRVSAIVVLDEPTPFFGGVVAAPVFARLAAFAARHFQVPPGAATLVASPTPRP